MKIVYICHAGQETGYGRAATDLAIALIGAGVELEVVPINPSLSSFAEGRAAALGKHVRASVDHAAFDAVIIHTMPMDCAEACERGAGWAWRQSMAGDDAGKDKVAIAYTTWEGVDVTTAVKASLFDPFGGDENGDFHFDDVWVPSTSTQDSFLNAEDAPVGVFVLPHCFDAAERAGYRRYLAEMDAGHQKQRQGGAFGFRYVGAWTTRKNPHGLIRAFAHAFTSKDDVELVIHSPGVSIEMFTAALVATGIEQRDAPKIRLSSERWSSEAMGSHDFYDCFVTATRGEAWNLPAFEAMLAGRMIIAPGGMGHDDFLFEDPETVPFGEDLTDAKRVASIQQPAFLDVELVQHVTVGGFEPESRKAGIQFKATGAQGLTSRTLWRDPDLVSLAYQMRQVYERRERDITLHYQPEDRFGYAAVAKQAIQRIEWLLQRKEGSK